MQNAIELNPAPRASAAGVASERARLHALFTQAPVGFAIFLGPTYIIAQANPAVCRLWGRTQAQVLGKPLFSALPEAAGQGFEQLLDGVLSTGVAYVGNELPAKIARREGGAIEDVYFNFVYEPLRDAQGAVEGVIVVATDATEAVRTRRAAAAASATRERQSEERLTFALQAGGLGHWKLDVATGRLEVSEVFNGTLGLRASEEVSTYEGLLERIHPDDRPLVAAAWTRALASRGDYEAEYRVLAPGGGDRWVLSRGRVACDLRGEPVGMTGVSLDTTERKRAETERERLLSEVRTARNRLHSLFENAPAFVCALRGPQFVFEIVNALYQRLVGQERQLVGRPLREALPELVTQGFVELLETVYRTGEPFIGREARVRLDRAGDGRLEDAFVTFVYQPTRDAQGGVSGIDVFGFEVTDQVEARRRVEALAEKLRESEERLRLVVDASGTGTWELNPATQDLEIDARFRELFGLSAEESVDLEKGLSLIHPEDRARVASSVSAALAGKDGGRYREDYRTLRFPEGRPQWVEARGQVSFRQDGSADRMRGTAIDSSARNEAEDRLQSFFRLVEGSGDFISWGSVDGALQYLNPAGRALAGINEAEVPGTIISDSWTPETQVLAAGAIPRLLKGEAVHFEGRLVHRGTGERIDMDISMMGVLDPSTGQPRALGCIARDIRGRRVREEEAHQRARFEQQLIGIVSHDLRNPLGAVLFGAAALARREGLDERSARIVLRIQSSAERAGRMVKDLLDFTQARLGGGIPVLPRPVNLHALARSVAEEVQASFPDRSIRVEARGDGQGAWDSDRLAQVLTNLLANALKYSPPGTGVGLSTREDGDWVELAVDNQGEPIPPEVLGGLFEPLQRATLQTDIVDRSVGLGLYIVKQIVLAHGGNVAVRSTAAEGTCFTVRLPRQTTS